MAILHAQQGLLCDKIIFQSYHFPSKDMLIEVILDLFIGYVDTELFKGIVWEVLKPKNVQQTYNRQLVPGEEKVIKVTK